MATGQPLADLIDMDPRMVRALRAAHNDRRR